MTMAAIWRVMAAATRKSFLEFIRYPANMIFSFFGPVVWTLPFYLLAISFTPDGTSAGLASWVGSSDFFSYFMIGLLVSLVISTVFWTIGFSMKRLMDIGVLETIWSCPIPKVAFVIGESIFALARLVYETALLYVIFRFVFGMRLPDGILSCWRYIPPFILLMYGFGIGFSALVLRTKDAGMMVDALNFVVTGLSGTQNPPQVFPRFLMAVSLALPVTYLIDIIRIESMGITPLIALGLEKAILVISAFVLPALGAWFFRRTDEKIRRYGTLHVH